MSRGLRLVGSFVLVAAPLPAQVVRGTVRDAALDAPIPGAIVTLEAADPGPGGRAPGFSVLTDARGEYSVQATTAGRYVLSAKRVGLKRFQSPPFSLGPGEAKRQDITLAPIDFTANTLAAVAVTAETPCSMDQRESATVATMWEEARAALVASRLALRDRLFRATMVRYTRELRPGSLRVLREDQVVRRGVTERPFKSLDPALLSSRGFMQPDPDGSSVFYAPDAEVLTSPEFLADHCFSVARPDKGHRGQRGLAFAPVASRPVPEIRGTMWLDSASYELRLVEFRYTKLADFASATDAGGEVRFSRTSNGTWFVSRWFIRMPQLRSARASAAVPVGGTLEVAFYREEGGDVSAEGGASERRGATLVGRAVDSTTRLPLRGAFVRLAGTRYSSPVGSDGSFRLDSLPAGAYTLTLEHPDYTALGVAAAEQELEIGEQSQSVTALQALGTGQLLRRLCGTGEFGDDRGAARVVVRTANGTPVAGATVQARFDTFESAGSANLAVRPVTFEGTTAADGSVMVCDLPARQPIRFTAAAPGSGVTAAQVTTIPVHEFAIVTFKP